MFKSFQDTSALQQFHGFPNLNMQQAFSAYGFSGVTFWLDAAYGLSTQTNLGAVRIWQPRIGQLFGNDTLAGQPRLILNDANYNNLPSVEAQDASRALASSTGVRLNQTGFTIAIVSKVNINQSVNAIIGNTASPNNSINDGGNNAGFNGFGWANADTQTVFQGTTESVNPRIKIISTNNIIINSIVEYTGTLNVNLELTFLFTSSGARRLVGSIAEIIAFGYSMTSDEAIALSNNLNQKYAIY